MSEKETEFYLRICPKLLVLISNCSTPDLEALTPCKLPSDILGVPNFHPLLACVLSVCDVEPKQHTQQ